MQIMQERSNGDPSKRIRWRGDRSLNDKRMVAFFAAFYLDLFILVGKLT